MKEEIRVTITMEVDAGDFDKEVFTDKVLDAMSSMVEGSVMNVDVAEEAEIYETNTMDKFNVGDVVVWEGTNPCIGIIESGYRGLRHGECYVLKKENRGGFGNADYTSCAASLLRLATEKEIKLLGDKDILLLKN